MDWSRLKGPQYVRIAPGAAERVAPYVGVSPRAICELVIDVALWPEEIQPIPMKGWNGILIAGDPVLLDAKDEGLIFSSSLELEDTNGRTVLVPWQDVRHVQVLGREPSIRLA